MIAKHFDTELMNPPETINPIDVFDGDKLEPLLVAIETQANSLVLDPTTTKGVKEIKSIAAKISKHKTAIDNAGKEYVAELKNKVKPIDAKRKMARDRLDALKEKIRQPVTEMEQQAKKLKEDADGAISFLLNASNTPVGMASDFRHILESVRSSSVDFGEYTQEVINAKNATIVKLNDIIIAKDEEEKQAKELAERQAKIDQEQREKDILAQAQREKQAEIDRAEREKREAIERAEWAEKQAEQQAAAAAEAERQRQIYKQQKEDNERIQREADAANREAKYKAIVDYFVASGVPEQNAAWVATELFNGNVPNVKVVF